MTKERDCCNCSAEQKDYSTCTVGQIVADNFQAAQVFAQYHIDFCCHGSTPFAEACAHSGHTPEEVVQALNQCLTQPAANAAPRFTDWPLDLLSDYVLKIHHRNIRTQGPQTEALLDKVTEVHAKRHPELKQVKALFHESLIDLENHLTKEENVLFPYIYELFEAKATGRWLPPFHCGTILHPISVMEDEHSHEGERYEIIASLTHGYTAPEDACASYRLALQQLHAFEQALHEHIHLENNLIFPRTLQLEQELARSGQVQEWASAPTMRYALSR